MFYLGKNSDCRLVHASFCSNSSGCVGVAPENRQHLQQVCSSVASCSSRSKLRAAPWAVIAASCSSRALGKNTTHPFF